MTKQDKQDAKLKELRQKSRLSKEEYENQIEDLKS